MRTRGDSSECDGKPDSPPGQKPAGGKRFHLKLPKLGRKPKGPKPAADVTDEPVRELLTFEQNLERRCLSAAGRQLIEREERLFGERNQTEALPVPGQEEDAGKLAEDRRALVDLVLQTVQQSLGPEAADGAAALKSAVRAICQEEEQDRRWRGEALPPPPWRPSSWKRLHDSVLRSAVEERMDSAPTPDGPGEQSSIQQDMCGMGRRMKEDLMRVVAVKSCYPPEMDVCNLYARFYHQVFSSRLSYLADFGLEERDGTVLLFWVNDYYPTMLQKAELVKDVDSAALGKLLPDDLTGPLEDQYLTNTQVNFQTCVDVILTEAERVWTDGVKPENIDGCFFSPLATDVVQFINGAMQLAEKVLGQKRKAQTILCLLSDVLQRVKKFQDAVVKRSGVNSRSVVMANLVCVEQFRDFITKKKDLFPEDVRESCLSAVTTMKRSGYEYLLSPVHKELKPQYRTLGTSDWLNKPLFQDLLNSVERHIKDLQGLTGSCHQELMEQLQEDVAVELVSRLLRGKVSLKDKEMQEKAARALTENGRQLLQLFAEAGARENRLHDILLKIAEVLQLQELPSIQIAVVSLGLSHRDLSDKHVSALLKLKNNLSSADRKKVKATLADSLAGTTTEAFTPFFSRVHVSPCKLL